MSVLTTRLARIGRKPVNIVGDGNCFFRSVSHQLYGTEDHHPQIRALAIQHLINCPEHFVEYNTDQSWLQYLQNMSTLGTWADHIIIQAVANASHLRINITESALNFSESTIVSSIYTQPDRRNARDIYIGHLDELHYVSTTPITHSVSAQTNQMTSAKTTSNSRDSQYETALMENLDKRRKYMKEYMKERRKDNELKKKELARKKNYNKKHKNLNPEKVKESWQKASATYRKSNPEKVKELVKRATATYTHVNPEKVKESRKQATALYRKSNPEKVRQSSKRATASYRNLNPEKVVESFKNSSRLYNQNYPERVQNIQKRKYIKRKQSCTEDENKSKQKRLESNSQDNSIETLHETSDDTRLPTSMSKNIELFHKNISVGPEYIVGYVL